MTNELKAQDAADWAMLKFVQNNLLTLSGLQVVPPGTPEHAALWRGLDHDWFRLIHVDITGRHYRLTATGIVRHQMLWEFFGEDKP